MRSDALSTEEDDDCEFYVSWLYMHPGRCSVCGCVWENGDKIQAGNLQETFNIDDGYVDRMVLVKWHLSCAKEMDEQ